MGLNQVDWKLEPRTARRSRLGADGTKTESSTSEPSMGMSVGRLGSTITAKPPAAKTSSGCHCCGERFTLKYSATPREEMRLGLPRETGVVTPCEVQRR